MSVDKITLKKAIRTLWDNTDIRIPQQVENFYYQTQELINNSEVMAEKEINALRFYLRVLQGFAESSLYDDYKEHEGFTDEEYGEALATLNNLVDRTKRIGLDKLG